MSARTAEGTASKRSERDVSDNLRGPEERERLEDDESNDLRGGAGLAKFTCYRVVSHDASFWSRNTHWGFRACTSRS